MKPQMDTD